MFAAIGVITVLFIVWKIFSAVLSGGVKGHMLRSVDHAMSFGVPYDFAQRMIGNSEIMKAAVLHLQKLESGFASKDVYAQYGEAIAMLYQGYLSEQKGAR